MSYLLAESIARIYNSVALLHNAITLPFRAHYRIPEGAKFAYLRHHKDYTTEDLEEELMYLVYGLLLCSFSYELLRKLSKATAAHLLRDFKPMTIATSSL